MSVVCSRIEESKSRRKKRGKKEKKIFSWKKEKEKNFLKEKEENTKTEIFRIEKWEEEIFCAEQQIFWEKGSESMENLVGKCRKVPN